MHKFVHELSSLSGGEMTSFPKDLVNPDLKDSARDPVPHARDDLFDFLSNLFPVKPEQSPDYLRYHSSLYPRTPTGGQRSASFLFSGERTMSSLFSPTGASAFPLFYTIFLESRLFRTVLSISMSLIHLFCFHQNYIVRFMPSPF